MIGGSSASDGAGSGNTGGTGGSPEVCPLQSTVTMTTQYTVTVTLAAAVDTSTSAASPMQDGSALDGSNATSGSAQNGSGNPSNGSGSASGNGSTADSSVAPKRTKCSKIHAAGTAASRASTGVGGLYGNATAQDSTYPVSANISSPSGSSTKRNSTGSLTGLNTTVTTNHTPDANLHGQFWAGGMYIPHLFYFPNRIRKLQGIPQ